MKKYNNLTELYKTNYYNLNEQVIKLKNESKKIFTNKIKIEKYLFQNLKISIYFVINR
jgi:hypothetical protein